MKKIFLLIFLASPFSSFGQEYAMARIYPILEIQNDTFRIKSTDENILRMRTKLDSVFHSTGHKRVLPMATKLVMAFGLSFTKQLMAAPPAQKFYLKQDNMATR